MIRVCFEPDNLTTEQQRFFEAWTERATRAKAEYDGSFRSEVWSELKVWLLANVFHGKCAYCEANVEATSFGDAEHYRPKGGVKEFVGGRWMPVTKDGRKHPGYYWVAYDWKNLLPACQRCNSGLGKRNGFPISGVRVFDEATAPDTETLNQIEQPLLLHPYDRTTSPSDHIVFTADGLAQALDIIGEESIRLLDLNRMELVNKRLSSLTAIREIFGIRLAHKIGGSRDPHLKTIVKEVASSLEEPGREFLGSIRDYFQAIVAQFV